MSGEAIITVAGNLVADPEARVSQAGKPWVTFRIANTPRVRDRNTNEWADGETLWLGCRAYGQEAENIAASLRKGQRVVVTGRLSQRSYTDNQGNERTALDLEIDEIGVSLKFGTATYTRGGGGGGGQGSAASYYGQPQTTQQGYAPQGAPQQQGGYPAQPQAQQEWGRPAVPQTSQENPWGQQPQQQDAPPQQYAQQQFGSGFDDERPF